VSNIYLVFGDYWKELSAIYLSDDDKLKIFRRVNKWRDFYKILGKGSVFKGKHIPISDKFILPIFSTHFAHHLWNELSVLDKIDQLSVWNNFYKIGVVQEPLLSIKRLFDSADIKIERYDSFKAIVDEAEKENYILPPLGGFEFNSGLTNKIHKKLEINVEVHRLLENNCLKDKEVFWISIKANDRTATNFIEFAVSFILSLVGKIPNHYIIFDGFTCNDYGTNGRYDDIIKSELAIVDEIINKTKITSYYITIGKSLNDSIILSRSANFYICHSGTIQHKVAWFNDIPGFIHTNLDTLKLKPEIRPGVWESNSSHIPKFIELEYVTQQKVVKKYWNTKKNYTLRNIPRINKSIINHYCKTIDVNSLEKYFNENPGRLIMKWSHYFDIYDRYLHRFRDKHVKMIEIGVNQGGSVQMWKHYLGAQSEIHAVYIDKRCKQFEEDQIKIHIGSQEKRVFLQNLVKSVGKFEIILDDGGHTMRQQIITFQELFPKLEDGGVYICEDCHTSYMPHYGGQYKNPNTFIEYIKCKIDSINAWHSKDPVLQPDYFTKNIDSICFYDSVVVITKKNRMKPFILGKGQKTFDVNLK